MARRSCTRRGSLLIVLFGIYAFGGFDRFLYPEEKVVPAAHVAVTQEPNQSEKIQRESQVPDYIVVLGIEDLLNQVNSRVLNSRGVIHKRAGEIGLVWKDAHGEPKYIHIRDLRDHNMTVNGVKFLATRENVKSGILNVLKKTS